MSAARLREAARVLRERSNAATPGPWEGGERCVWSSADTPGGVVVGDAPNGSGGVEYATDADYIATMHPGVALALADWLDEAGADYFAFGDDEHHAADHEPCDECDSDPRAPHLRRALTVADQILGVEEATP